MPDDPMDDADLDVGSPFFPDEQVVALTRRVDALESVLAFVLRTVTFVRQVRGPLDPVPRSETRTLAELYAEARVTARDGPDPRPGSGACAHPS